MNTILWSVDEQIEKQLDFKVAGGLGWDIFNNLGRKVEISFETKLRECMEDQTKEDLNE